MALTYLETDAVISDCGVYRYVLRRLWDRSKPSCLFLMLNPSTADATLDDRTIRRCVDFAHRWGYGELVVVNLFALRATNPSTLRAHPVPIGPENDASIEAQARRAVFHVAAWGAERAIRGRDAAVRAMFEGWGIPLHYLELTAEGHPKHPLYVLAETQPALFD